MKHKTVICALFVGLLIFVSIPVYSQVMIIDRPPKDIKTGSSLPIRSHVVTTKIREQVAVTQIEQVFHNPYNRQIEATYVLTVPITASVSKFTLEVDGEQINAEMLDKDKAENIYQEIVRKTRDPGILSYVGNGLIRAKIFPIPAKSNKKIEIRYEEVLPFDNGIFKYQYPLATDKVSKQAIDFIKITVDLDSDSPIRNIYSPTHDIDVKKKSNYKASIKYSDENVKPTDDFQLIFTSSKKAIGLNLLTYKEKGEKGFFMLLAAPKIPAPDEITAKDVVFVLDTSGSMKKNNKIAQAKEALQFCVESLNEKDRFAIVTFSDSIDTLTDKLTVAEKANMKKLIKNIKSIQASGGTNIDGALEKAFNFVDDDKRPTYILFLTDGLPTVGERDVNTILKHSNRWNKHNCRLFTFGVGYDVNTNLLDILSQKNKGLSTYVKPKEDIEVSVSSLYTKISDPVLSDLQVNFDSISKSKVYPQDIPDLFSGSQLVVLGRYDKGGSDLVTLKGKVNQDDKSYKEEFTFTKKNTSLEFIPRLWASRRIGFLMNQIRDKGRDKELVDEIIELSQKYGILTKFTSFLVTEDTPPQTRPVSVRSPMTRDVDAIDMNISSGRVRGSKQSSLSRRRSLGDLTTEELKEVRGGGYMDTSYSYDFDGYGATHQANGESAGMGGMGMGGMGMAASPQPLDAKAQSSLQSLGYTASKPQPSIRKKEAVVESEVMQNQLSNAKSLSTQNVKWNYDDQGNKQVEQIQGVKYAGNQAFFQQGKNWVSTQWDEKKEILKIEPYSDAYFELSKISKDVAKILALGTYVQFVRNDVMVQIVDKGLKELTEKQLDSLK
jgi:Ca-activated chloride channel family protein